MLLDNTRYQKIDINYLFLNTEWLLRYLGKHFHLQNIYKSTVYIMEIRTTYPHGVQYINGIHYLFYFNATGVNIIDD